MLQIKYISLNEEENLKLYSEIINEVAREYEEFTNYRINNDLEGLLLEFNVNNSYRDFNLTFLKEDFEFEKNIKGAEYKISYFNNERDTNAKVIIDKYDDSNIRLQTLKNNKVLNLLMINKENYNLSFYDGILLEDNKVVKENLNLDILCNEILNHIGINMGYLFSRRSKDILKNDLERIIF